jgi:mono/diheme cytochrome c family protein
VTATLSCLLGLISISGCDDEYAADLRYGVRNDPLVTQKIATVPTQIDKPGDFPDRILVGLTETEKKSILDPRDLKSNFQQDLESTLQKYFGTPRQPVVDGIDETAQKTLMLDHSTLAEGSRLYRQHCLHCHGVTGNGRGPTAPWVNPHPRDYRKGVFKFTSVTGGNDRKPRRDDLLRTLREGLEGTTMPSFGLLTDKELNELASYVIHLSIRGDVEFKLMQYALLQDEREFSEIQTAVVNSWMAAAQPTNLINPPPPPEADRKLSVQRGWELFKGPTGGCIGCHKDYGRQSLYFYDDWGTIGRAADLTLGVYRGGRRPIDFYWRIYNGVNGSNMSAFSGAVKPEQLWDIVHFVQVLPYKRMREEFGIEID